MANCLQCKTNLKMFRKSANVRLSAVTAGCVVLMLMTTRSALGQIQYVVKGTVTDRFYNPSSQVVQEAHRYQYEVFVSGKQWRIDLYQTDLTNNITRRTIGSDNGEEVVHLAVNNRGPSFVLVEPQRFPVGWNTPAFVHLWLMYASGSFFTNGVEGIEPPIYRYAYCNMRPEVDLPNEQVIVQLNGQEPKLPRLVVFYEGRFPNTALQEQSGASSQLPDDCYTNAIYEASDFKTVGKLQLPTKIRFKYFLDKTDGRNLNHNSLMYSCEAEADSINDKCPAGMTTITLPAHYVAYDLRISAASISNLNASLHGPPKRGNSPTYNGNDFSRTPTLKELNKFIAAGGRVGLANEHKRMVRIVLGISVTLPLALLLIRTFRLKKVGAAKDQVNPE
jgi:hypothetical protein